MDSFLDISEASLNKRSETLCGDKVKVLRTPEKSIIVLSDGLGSGVKANILATLTSEIIVTMLAADVCLEEVIRTVIGTLPTCKVRNVAYATFTVLRINHPANTFQVINFDNPPTLYFRRGHLVRPDRRVSEILGRKVATFEGDLQRGDFLGLLSDGVLYAGMGVEMNFGWGWDNIARHIEGRFLTHYRSARDVVRDVTSKTRALYRNEIGDDATFVGVYVRAKKSMMVLTGPPVDPDKDDEYVRRLMDFDGMKVVCGGTTAHMVAAYLGERIETNIATLRPDVPPIGHIAGLDLVTEGILTLSRALEYLRVSEGHVGAVPSDRNGAAMLATELLRADHIHFLVGQQINEFYQNPLLPKALSVRVHLVKEISDFLLAQRKEVTVEYC